MCEVVKISSRARPSLPYTRSFKGLPKLVAIARLWLSFARFLINKCRSKRKRVNLQLVKHVQIINSNIGMFCFLKFSNLNNIRKILKFNRLNTSTEPIHTPHLLLAKKNDPWSMVVA